MLNNYFLPFFWSTKHYEKKLNKKNLKIYQYKVWF
jgi:hypothetical protein